MVITREGGSRRYYLRGPEPGLQAVSIYRRLARQGGASHRYARHGTAWKQSSGLRMARRRLVRHGEVTHGYTWDMPKKKEPEELLRHEVGKVPTSHAKWKKSIGKDLTDPRSHRHTARGGPITRIRPALPEQNPQDDDDDDQPPKADSHRPLLS